MTTRILGLAVVLMIAGGLRAEAAQPSSSKLRQMGLDGATIVSDAAALEVRGLGYARVWGHSFVKRVNRYEGEYAEAYNAYDAKGNHDAAGFAISVVVDPGPIVIGGNTPGAQPSVATGSNGFHQPVVIKTIFAGGYSRSSR